MNFLLFEEKRFFPWFNESSNILSKASLSQLPSKETQMILFRDKMRDDPSLRLLNFKTVQQDRHILLNCNKELINEKDDK